MREARSEVSRESCFYGGAFPLFSARSEPRGQRRVRCPGTFPKAFCVGDCARRSLLVSFDCDSLSEEGVRKSSIG